MVVALQDGCFVFQTVVMCSMSWLFISRGSGMLIWSERSPAFIVSVRVLGKHGGGVTSAVFSGNTETSGEFINNDAIFKTISQRTERQSYLVKSF